MDKKRIEELENNWKRALADYRNLEKRVAEERDIFLAFANSMLLLRLLPVLDNLEALSKHMDDEGLKMTIKDFKRVLSEEGIKEIEVEGKKFDAEKMEAIDHVDGPKDEVVEVLQKGYLMKDKVLRPARVKVGSGKE
jgi:molecular chaperone GrpE